MDYVLGIEGDRPLEMPDLGRSGGRPPRPRRPRRRARTRLLLPVGPVFRPRVLPKECEHIRCRDKGEPEALQPTPVPIACLSRDGGAVGLSFV